MSSILYFDLKAPAPRRLALMRELRESVDAARKELGF